MEPRRNFYLKISLLLIFFLHAASFAQKNRSTGNLEKDTIIAGFSAHIFTQANLGDAKAALGVIMNEIISGYWKRGEILTIPKTYNSINEIKKEIEANKLEMITLTSAEYLILKDQVKITPLLTYKWGSIVQDKILLLARQESGIKSVKDLNKKKVSIFSFVTDEFSIPTLWYRTMVLSSNENYKKDYGPFIEQHVKSSQAIMDAFFKKTSAVIVSEKEFNIAKELNPQLGKQFKVIANSKPILYSAICYTEKLKEHKNIDIKELIDSFCTVHNKRLGKHFLQIFKVSQFIPFKDEYMNNTEELYKEFIAVSKRKKKSTD